MKTVRFFQIIIFFSALFFSGISADAQTDVEVPADKISEADLIHYGDLIDVDILGSSEFDWRGTLTPEGNLAGLDFIEEPVFALCRTASEVETNVAVAYSKILREPKIKVTILDRSNRPLATIFGAVKSQQRFQIKRLVLLNELLVLSGGFTEKSNGVVQIFRASGQNCLDKEIVSPASGGEQEKFVRTSQTGRTESMSFSVVDLLSGKYNPQIMTGDLITAMEANPIYVIGGVKNPKSIAAREKMTLSRAISTAGGFSKDAEKDKITIFRKNGLLTDIIEVDYEKITAGSEDDPNLQDFDIVEVGVKGRSKNKFPPIIEKADLSSKPIDSLPLRIID